jgi:hypothetical protein
MRQKQSSPEPRAGFRRSPEPLQNLELPRFQLSRQLLL